MEGRGARRLHTALSLRVQRGASLTTPQPHLHSRDDWFLVFLLFFCFQISGWISFFWSSHERALGKLKTDKGDDDSRRPQDGGCTGGAAAAAAAAVAASQYTGTLKYS